MKSRVKIPDRGLQRLKHLFALNEKERQWLLVIAAILALGITLRDLHLRRAAATPQPDPVSQGASHAKR